MIKLILGLLLGLLLGAASPTAAQRMESFPNLTPTRWQWEVRENRERHDRQFQAEQNLTELRLLRMSIDQQTQELQQQHQRALRRRLWEGE